MSDLLTLAFKALAVALAIAVLLGSLGLVH